MSWKLGSVMIGAPSAAVCQRLVVLLLGATAAMCVPAALSAVAAEFALAPGASAVGSLQRHVVRRGDVFPDLARRYDLGYTALVGANPGIDPWGPGLGRPVAIPSVQVVPQAPHAGIVINLAQWRLFYFPSGGGRVLTFPIGIGVIGRRTPLGATRVVRKEPNPVWVPPPSIRAEEPDLPAVVPAGPENPLGAFALHLGWPRYLVHGTNKPDGVGRNVSHGCIRLYPEDIEKLFAAVPVGTPVHVVDQPATAGWAGNALYLQVYPSQAQTEEIDTEQRVTRDPAQGVRAVVRAAAGNYADAVDWAAVDRAADARTGMAVRVAEIAAYAGAALRSDDGEAPPAAATRTQQRFDRLLRWLTRADADDAREPVRRYEPEATEPYIDPHRGEQ